jgi:hypothetical protein
VNLTHTGVSAHTVAATLDPNSVSPGLLGFIIVCIIGLITWFLARSMTKQLRKLEVDHPDHEEDGQLDQEAAPHEPEPNGAH